MNLKDTVFSLSEAYGASGSESPAAELACGMLKEYCPDAEIIGGSVIGTLGEKGLPELLLDAHIDQVGLIVTYITDDGFIKFSNLGGLDRRLLPAQPVVIHGKRDIKGVICSVPPHLTNGGAEVLQFDETAVDAGMTKEELEEIVSLGERRIRSKAIDDRAGCAMMIRLMHEELEYDTYFVFNVQEEIGLRGSRVSATAVAPDFAIVLESTTAADIDGADGAKKVCSLGGGPVVSFMDRSTVYDKELYRLAFDLAKEENIPCQTKTRVAGGNDAGAIHISGTGVRTIAVSVPCRYLHSPSSVIETADLESSYTLVKALAKRIPQL